MNLLDIFWKHPVSISADAVLTLLCLANFLSSSTESAIGWFVAILGWGLVLMGSLYCSFCELYIEWLEQNQKDAK